MNKELVVYTSFSQVMVHEKIAMFFYSSRLVPDLLEHYVIVCTKSVYYGNVEIIFKRFYRSLTEAYNNVERRVKLSNKTPFHRKNSHCFC